MAEVKMLRCGNISLGKQKWTCIVFTIKNLKPFSKFLCENQLIVSWSYHSVAGRDL
jgi:hypothetical protein